MNITNYTSKWEHKKTGKFVTLISTIHSFSSGVTVKVMDEKGKPLELKESEFNSKFSPVKVDYQEYKDSIAELCNLCDEFGKLGNVILKRLDPTYFEVGKLVYISNCAFFKRADFQYYGGPEHPYKIVWIKEKSEGYGYDCVHVYLEVGILLVGKKDEDEYDYVFPIYPTMPQPEDAYWFLTRYDKPY